MTTFSTQTIGRTEKALGAILLRELDGTGISEPQWVTLSLTAITAGAPQVEQLARVAGVFKIDPSAAEARFAELIDQGLIDDDSGSLTLTDAGRALYERTRANIEEITSRLWGDLPADDLDTAGRVLSTVLARADAQLQTGQCGGADAV
jgi:DNA-binding MarR family transcriptional regulator